MSYYNIAFDPNCNDAEGMMYWMWAYYDSPIELTANEYTRAGYRFTVWNTEADGSGIAFADEAMIEDPLTYEAYDVVTLYAQWERVLHTVTVSSDAGCTVSVVVSDSDLEGGTPIQSGDRVPEGTVLSVTAAAKTGYTLDTVPAASYTVTGDITVTVTSRKKTYSLEVIHTNGAAPAFVGADSLDAVPYGTQIVLTPGAADEGYAFIGWDKTAEQINASLAGGNVTVNAMFTPVQQSFTVTVYNGESETPETIVCTESKRITRTATAVSGKHFAYWMLNGAVLSYNTKASFTAVESGELRAVYTADAVEAVGTATLRTAKYNLATRKLSVNVYLTVPDGSSIVSAGLVAAPSGSFSGELTSGNAAFTKSSAAAVGKCAPVSYTWNKSSADSSDCWYARAYLVYTLDGTEHTVYGDLATVAIPGR